VAQYIDGDDRTGIEEWTTYVFLDTDMREHLLFQGANSFDVCAHILTSNDALRQNAII
jgi:hypothetical protein